MSGPLGRVACAGLLALAFLGVLAVPAFASAPVAISTSFGASSVPLGGSTSLTFAISDTDSMASLAGVGFTDNLPSGLVVATPSGVSDKGCGGAATAAAGSGSVSLADGSLAPRTVCEVSVNVTGVATGVKDNSVPVEALGGAGNTGFGLITVAGPPQTFTAACAGTVGDPKSLVTAIDAANANAGADTVRLGAGCTYTLTAADNNWYGPNGLPAIAGDVTIEGDGATIARSASAPAFRLLFVGADPSNPGTPGYVSPGPGVLTLRDVTLTGGLAKGGDSNLGGGGAGMGGAIFSQGSVVIEGSTLTDNTAQGGSAINGSGQAGGGIGTGSSATDEGGGFGAGSFPGGAAGGARASAGGGGGAGFRTGDTGGSATASEAGAGGGPATGLGGNGAEYHVPGAPAGDGSGGGSTCANPEGSGGGGFGAGSSGNCSAGGVGGGGAVEGSGGFGGGGGFGDFSGGSGGFGGGGGGSTNHPGAPGFGGGTPETEGGGGGGAGMGGAIFNMQGALSIRNSTLAGNTAIGGTDTVKDPGKGIAGAVFNLSGAFTATDSTIARNVAAYYASQIYNLIYDGYEARTAQTTLVDTIVADGVGSPAWPFDLASSKTKLISPSDKGSANANLSQFDLVRTTNAQEAGTITGSPLTGDPLLGPLADNGGPTWTMALASGSPAIAAAGSGCLPIDQRGEPRPEDGAGACDIGAYQTQPPPVAGGGGAGSAGGAGSVSGAGAPGGGSGGSGGAVLAAVDAETLSPRAFSAYPRGPSALAAKRRRYGTQVRYTLNEAAVVRFTVVQPEPGRSSHGRCAKPTKANRRARGCTRTVTLRGSFTRSGVAGVNSFRFTGRLQGRRLKRGKYELVATPSAGGKTGRAKSAPFQITG